VLSLTVTFASIAESM